MPPVLSCDTCEADLHDSLAVEGFDAHAGQRVHLLDTGPGHADLAAHPVVVAPRPYGRALPRTVHPQRPEWLPPIPSAQAGLEYALQTYGSTAAGPVVFWTDVSEWQGTGYTDAYTRPVAAYRVTLSTTKVDGKLQLNRAWCHAKATAKALTAHIGYHVWYPGNEQAQARYFFDNLGSAADDRFVAMIDVESWSGAISGDHSDSITALANLFAARLGQKRVKVYANSGDLAAIYPRRPAWLGIIKAGYSSHAPAEPWDGWQFTDGETKWPVISGWPRASAPFGACDHNAFYGTTAQFAAAYGVTPKVQPPQPVQPQPSHPVIPGVDRLNIGTYAPGARINSPDNNTTAWFQPDGNLVVYTAGKPTYATGTNSTAAGVPGRRLDVQPDGNLVIYGGPGEAHVIWQSHTSGQRGTYTLVVQNDGNLVLYGPSGAVWDSRHARY